MKKNRSILLGLGVLFFGLLGFSVSAQQVPSIDIGEIIQNCPDFEVELQGAESAKVGVPHRLIMQTSLPVTLMQSVEHEVWSGDTVVVVYDTEQFSHVFPQSGKYVIKTVIRDGDDCTYSYEKPITVYDRIFTYIGTVSDEFRLMSNSLGGSSSLFYEVTFDESVSFNDEQLLQKIIENKEFVQYADVLFFDGQVLQGFLSILPRFLQLVGGDFSSSDLYVLSQINQSAFRRLVSTYHELAGIDEISVLPKQYFGSLLNMLVLEKNPNTLDSLTVYSTELFASHQRAFVSYLIDYLLYHNLPLSFLMIVLLLPVLVVITAIFRQVVGFSVYGVFNPIIVAFSLHFMGVEPTLFFSLVAMLSVMLVNIFVHRVYLLYTSKIALLVIVYSFLILCGLTIVRKYNFSIFADQQFTNMYMVFPIIFLMMVAYSIFKEKVSFFRRSWLVGFLQFLLVCTLLYHVIRWSRLQNILLGYPELLLAVFVLTIVIGRFTGLQLTEYVRFMPLISWYLNDKDEEEE